MLPDPAWFWRTRVTSDLANSPVTSIASLGSVRRTGDVTTARPGPYLADMSVPTYGMRTSV